MKPSDDSIIDWAGLGPDLSPIEPLNEATFTVRLRLLSERAASMTLLRNVFAQQRSNGKQLPRDSEPAS